jgi:sugar/nucleoside kinase (ribokinase family)
MARKMVITAIGEALLVQRPDRIEPGGLALSMAIQAARFGHVGLPISRIGQDDLAADLCRLMDEHGLDRSHLQSDPDLNTGRLIIRTIAGRTQHRLDPRAAFDNLQWDFDLEDAAQRTDVAVFGALSSRSGQTRTVLDRFMVLCDSALCVVDLTNRGEDQSLERAKLSALMVPADVAVVDAVALHSLVPSAPTEPQDSYREAVQALMRQAALSVVVTVAADEPLHVHTAEDVTSAAQPHQADRHDAVLMALLHGLAAGWTVPAALSLADRVSQLTGEHPADPVPAEWLDG